MPPPVFVASHPRACSTAFERVFMTRRDSLTCVHEPFGDAFYYGPERLSSRFEGDPAERETSGFSGVTYKHVMDHIDTLANEDKRVFIKDMAYYLFPEHGAAAESAPSLLDQNSGGSEKPGTHLNGTNGVGQRNGVTGANGTNGVNGANGVNGFNGVNGVNGVNGHHGQVDEDANNPCVIPARILRNFHFTFLIRHPRRAIPSYFRCTVPPLDKVTGFSDFMPSEAGYDELRRLFDYLKDEGMVVPAGSGHSDGAASRVPITVIDADDLLDNPAGIIEAFCKRVGIEYTPDMLHWEDQENQEHAVKAFQKWNGFHDDVLGSTYLKPRSHAMKTITVEEENKQWREKFGEKGQETIRKCVDTNVPHYEYLKSFAIKV